MTKKEAVELLKQAGHDVAYEDGLIRFYNTDFKVATKACKSIGYKSSYGVRERNVKEA